MQRSDQLWYHAIWSTKHHRDTLDKTHLERIPSICTRRAEEWHFHLEAVGGYRDHVHVLLSIPPDLPVAKVIGWIKGSTSHAFGKDFAWQSGYVIETISPDEVSEISAYIGAQEVHHTSGNLQMHWEPPHYT